MGNLSLSPRNDADGGDRSSDMEGSDNILNKQSRTADKGRSSSLGIGHGVSNF